MGNEQAIEEFIRSLGDEDAADRCVRFESLGEVYFGTENCIGPTSFRSHVADDNNAGIDTDTGLHRRFTSLLPFDSELANAFLHIDRHPNASCCVVGLRFGITEKNHKPAPQEFVAPTFYGESSLE